MSQHEDPREGGDLHLTCRANKHLYGSLSWRRLHPAGGGGGGRTFLTGHSSTGDFSRSLRLSLSNLSTQDSGAYMCAAHHRLTGQEAHLVVQVRVSGESLLDYWTERRFGLHELGNPFDLGVPSHEEIKMAPLSSALFLDILMSLCVYAANKQTVTLTELRLFGSSGPLGFLRPHPAFARHLFHVGMGSHLEEEHTMALPTMPHLQPPALGRGNNQPIRHCQAPGPRSDNHQLLSGRKIGETTIKSPRLSDFASCLRTTARWNNQAPDRSTSFVRDPRSGNHYPHSG